MDTDTMVGFYGLPNDPPAVHSLVSPPTESFLYFVVSVHALIWSVPNFEVLCKLCHFESECTKEFALVNACIESMLDVANLLLLRLFYAGTPDYTMSTEMEASHRSRYKVDWRSEMETRLAIISQDVKTTRSDIAEVLCFLKNQPSTILQYGTYEETDSQNKQAKYAHNYGANLLSKGLLGEGGK